MAEVPEGRTLWELLAEAEEKLCSCEASNWQTELMEQCSIHAPRLNRKDNNG